MTNTPMTKEAFEAWHKSEYQGHNSYSYKHDTTAYIDDHVEIAFVAWQASQAQQAQTIAELVEALELIRTETSCLYEDEHTNTLIKRLIRIRKKVDTAIAKVKGK